jgi:hypothetical protein
MSRFEPTASGYVVLRLDSGAEEWLEAARLRAFDAPHPIRALLAGRTRIEVERAESERVLTWAAQLPGWNDDGRPPIYVYAPGEIVISR